MDGDFSDHQLFIFCRALKALELTRGWQITSKELGAAFARWHPMAEEKSGKEMDFDEYRYDFIRIFSKTRVALGGNPMAEAMQRADSQPLPKEAKRYTSAKIKRLIAVCYQLQVLAGEFPFFLSVRDAAEIIGSKKPESGAVFLDGLVMDGILSIVEKGQSGGHKATRFAYVQKD